MIELFQQYQALILLCGIAFVSLYACRYICLPIFKKVAKRSKGKFDDLLVEHRAIERFAHIVPAVILYRGLPAVLSDSPDLFQVLFTLNNVYFIVVGFLVYDSCLRALADSILLNPKKQGLPIQGVRQAGLLLGFLICTILVISQITNKSPVILLSGLGALAAVFMLVFKDSILGFAAGVQIALLDLVRTGDWIEIPKENVNGTVDYVSLTSIRIQNWDNTTSVLPAYTIVSTTFKNWRHMQDSGRRCLQRSILIDSRAFGYLTDEQIAALKADKTVLAMLGSKIEKISEKDQPINMQLFREFATIYIRSLDKVDPQMTHFVREQNSTGFGIPLEIYLFTTETSWANFENFGSDIVDYLMAKLPLFGLKVYQRS
ncbi:MAG: mechanosensitive ion channel [Fibrobacter sp.]|nr:mechanosensitive ion channel [Fibrobacter sp.]